MSEVRFASFNVFLNRSTEGELIADLSTPDDEQAQAAAEILQRNRPDVVLLNEFDYDADGFGLQMFQDNYLSVAQADDVEAIEYPYVYLAPSNTGIAAEFDFNNDGEIATTVGDRGYGDDSFGFGFFPGQFAMALLSQHPIVEEEVRTFQHFLWKDMPGALLPTDPEDADGNGDTENWYTEAELDVFRLSSKSHWDVPINVDGEIIHVLASHPTPPVFDGPEDRNGTRNHDEIRFWSDYITPDAGAYIYDDEAYAAAGNTTPDNPGGGLESGEFFVIMGDQNADPYDGNSIPGAIQQLLNNPRINVSVSPGSVGGEDAADRQAGGNIGQLGDPAFDTGDFNDSGVGNLRADYVLPTRNLDITEAGTLWPSAGDELFDLVGVGFPVVSSDHRLVYADVSLPEQPFNTRKTVSNIEFLGQAVVETGFLFGGTEVGGLSGVAYDPLRDVYYALSDDRGNRSGPIPEAGSLSEYLGFNNGSYFIEVPDDQINDFFSWNEDYPDLVSAHRGGFTTGFPENAIATFENTLSLTPALLEVDVRRTADGEWILMHDDTLDRTTTGTGLVSETTLAEIQELQLVDNDGNVTDFKVPTLQEALAWAEGRTILELDLKSDDFFEEVVQIITDLDAEDQTRFITQNLQQATGIYTLNPDIHLGLSINSSNQADVFAGIEAAPFGVETVSAFTSVRPQTEEFYDALHNEGIVAIQGLFGDQDFFGEGVSINGLTNEQRTELFETVYARGGDVIASDFSATISELLDYSQSPLSRYYTLTIDLDDGRLEDGDVAFTDVTSLLDADGAPFTPGVLDPEGVALNSQGTLFIASEGDANNLVAPFVNEFSLSGREIRALPIPEKFLPTADNTSGIRNNQAFESLTLTPDQRILYTATEEALNQDGPRSTLSTPSPSRILSYDLTTGEAAAEYLYLTDPIPDAPEPADGFAGNGLVELLAIDNNGTLLALERSFAVGVGNNLRLYEVNLPGASDISNLDSIADNDLVRAADKRLLLDFGELGIDLDNSEALVFGPELEDGRQSLFVVSDNNFNAGTQVNQFLAFALDIEVAPQSTLTGFASLDADTFAPGPASGVDGPISAERPGPFPGQPVGGWSGVQFADDDSLWFIVDSLFGGDTDTLLRIYKVDPDFAGFEGGDGSVLLEEPFITLSDPNNLVPFDIRNSADPARPLTGADFDAESLVIDANGDIWVGDEYGPYLLHFDSNGVLLEAPIPTPNILIDGMAPAAPNDQVRTPQNPDVEAGLAEPNLRGSRGFEGIGYSPDRTVLYPILEAPVEGDPENALRIYQYDIATGTYADELVGFYPLDDSGETPTFQLGDLTPINDHEFLAIERDDFQADDAFFKKVFKIDISQIDDNGFVHKEEVIDLLDIADPNDLNGDNSLVFDLPITSVESVLVIDEKTVLVSVDNNYPFGSFASGRPPALDNNEIILVELAEPLDLDPRLGINAFSRDITQGDRTAETLAGGIDGDDFIFGGDGDDVLRGDLNARDSQVGIGDNDAIYGEGGRDRIGGKGGDDLLFGGDGDDQIWGDDGDDLLHGGLGDDILTGDDFSGGQGSDIFVLAVGEGTDLILDFEVGVDFIGLADGLTFGALSFSGEVITAGDEILAILQGVNTSALVESHFLAV